MVRLFFYLICCAFLSAQQIKDERAIVFPNLSEHLTLIGDFHTHTVFSDADVWPNIRVKEANLDYLDVLAITDHLYQDQNYAGNKFIDISDKNRAFNIAQKYVKNELLLINGVELSRKNPLGHVNAVFVNDVNKFIFDDEKMMFLEAKKQNAFVFWNHPYRGQEPYGTIKLPDIHKDLIDQGLMHGIEIVNRNKFSEHALQIALDNNLTLMGNSDIHGIIDWEYEVSQGGHRPVTIVFSKNRSQESVREALLNRQTVVWHKNNLIGRKEWLIPLIKSSLTVEKFYYKYDKSSYKKDLAYVEITNNSDAKFVLKNIGMYEFFENSDLIEILPHKKIQLQVITLGVLDSFNLDFEVLNAIYKPRKHPKISLEVR